MKLNPFAVIYAETQVYSLKWRLDIKSKWRDQLALIFCFRTIRNFKNDKKRKKNGNYQNTMV